MLKKKEYVDKIDLSFAEIIAYIDLKNKKNQFDINIFCEDFFCELLNEIYGLELENLNRAEYKNYPAIDLGDRDSGVSYQITSTNTSDKIKTTLEKVKKYKLYENFTQINILILGEKKKYTSKKLIDPKDEFEFSIKDNILDISDISRYIFDNKTIEDMERIYLYLTKNKVKYSESYESTNKIKKKKKSELTKDIMEKLLQQCDSTLETDVSEANIDTMLNLIRKCSQIEKSMLKEILDEYNCENKINLNDIFNEYEDLNPIVYLTGIINLMNKKFIEDVKQYTYMDEVHYISDEIEEVQFRIRYGIWDLDYFGRILNELENILEKETFSESILR